MNHMPQAYSPGTINRRFEVINELVLAGSTWLVLYDQKTPFAAIVNAEVSEINGEPRHRVVATLEMARRDQCGEIFSVQDFWQDTDALKVEGVVVEPALQDMGLATLLYECLVIDKNITLMSDNLHYEGGKALWKKIAKSSKKLTVFVLDTDTGKFFPYDGTRVRYEGISIPEAEIWSIHPDNNRYGVILIAEDRRKHTQVAA